MPELGVAMVWFDFDFDFVGCRGCRSWGLPWFGFFIYLDFVGCRDFDFFFFVLKMTLVFN